MLVLFHVLPRDGAQWSGEVVDVGINPEIIDRAEVAELAGYDGEAVQLRLQGDEVCFVRGTVAEAIRATQEPPCLTAENTDGE